MERPWHNRSAASVLAALRTGRDGLSEREAARRARTHGLNELPRERADGWFRIVARQFAGPLMLLLVAAAAVSAALGDLVDATVILAALVLNAAVGFAQEARASRTLEGIRTLVRPSCVVRRAGHERSVPAAEVVVGDILVLRAGDRVAADARIVASWACETNEAVLTGESLPVAKDAAPSRAGALLAERPGMAYAGTSVVSGRAEAAVTAVGTGTELGKVAAMVSGTQEGSTPLQDELRRLSAWIGLGALAVVLALFALGVATGRPTAEMFRMGVALAVAAVPEGLTLSVTVVLAVGMRRILARGSLVRRLAAAETLGSVSVICTDKTGTITLGEMRVAEVVPSEGASVRPAETPLKAARGIVGLLEAAMLCNDAVVERGADGEAVTAGSPTERALMEAGRSAGIGALALARRHPRLAEVPFDPVRKEMATLHGRGDGHEVILKGAPERVLARCLRMEGPGGRPVPLTAARHAALERKLRRMALDGLRVIAVARKPVGAHPAIRAADMGRMTFVGFLGLRDPLREQAREHVALAARSGIRTVLVTGDHPDTARTIAREAGLPARTVVTGPELDLLDDAALARRVTGVSVYARVEPRHKIRLVRAWRARGAVVAMVGDGVNDAPALKAADVGVALGSGTEVAKEASDIVLLDNDLGTVTAAVEQGRIIFDNIRKMAVYLLADSFTEIVLIGGSILAGLPLPLTPLQVLWINLVADSLPNAALTMEPGEPDVMRRRPRDRRERVLDRGLLFVVFAIGLVTDLFLFLLYAWLLRAGYEQAHIRTVLFAAAGIDSLLYVFAVRSFRRPAWRIPLFSNPWLLAGVLAGFGLMGLALAFPPLAAAFGNVPLDASDLLPLLCLAAVKLVMIELSKRFVLRPGGSRG